MNDVPWLVFRLISLFCWVLILYQTAYNSEVRYRTTKCLAICVGIAIVISGLFLE